MTIDKKDGGLPPVQHPTLEGAGLDSLGGMVADIDSQAHEALNPGAAAAAAEAAIGPDYHKGACGIVDLARGMIGGYAPGAAWDDQTSARMAASLTPVFEKYGWDVESAFPCELVALMVCGPVLYQSAQAVALKIRQDRFALEHAQRGLSDPNTVKGAAATQSGPPAASQTSGDTTAEAALSAALAEVPAFPVM
jgi:hypothetical protein